MRAPIIDLLPRRPRWVFLVWTGALLCYLLAGYYGYEAWNLRLLNKAIDRDNLILAKRLGEVPSNSENNTPKDAALILGEKEFQKLASFPMQDVLASIERARVTNVRLMEFNVRADQGVVDLSVEFGSYRNLFDYIERLNEGDAKGVWSLNQSSIESAQVPGKAIIVWRVGT